MVLFILQQHATAAVAELSTINIITINTNNIFMNTSIINNTKNKKIINLIVLTHESCFRSLILLFLLSLLFSFTNLPQPQVRIL